MIHNDQNLALAQYPAGDQHGVTRQVKQGDSLTNDDAKKKGHVTRVPKAVMRSRPAEIQGQGLGLPDELQVLLVHWVARVASPVGAAQSLRNLGLSCKHWGLHVRNYLDGADGRALRREVDVERFRKAHRLTPVAAYRNSSSSAHLTYSDFESHLDVSECVAALKTSAFPVHLRMRDSTEWLNGAVRDGLASRGARLTVLEFECHSTAYLVDVIRALQQVPRGGFVALEIYAQEFSAFGATALCQALAAHPVVCHLSLIGNNGLETDKQVCEWLEVLANQETGIESLSLQCCNFDENSAEQLAAAINGLTEVRELEIVEKQPSLEFTQKVTDAVRARNQQGGTQMTLHFTAQDSVLLKGEAANDDSFAGIDFGHGIHFRNAGQLWDIEEDAAPVAAQSKDSLPTVEEVSADEESSSTVGSASSDEDGYDSDFPPSSDSDSIVASSDDSYSDSDSDADTSTEA